ncbi:hypothetical protein BJV77DRAFT_968298 [Russula vinacea]|nr:hypothetical protein BJV77DRAFT_968298 [Russula vinacea]
MIDEPAEKKRKGGDSPERERNPRSRPMDAQDKNMLRKPGCKPDDIDDNSTQIVHVENPATFAASCFFQSHGLRRDTGTVFVLVYSTIDGSEGTLSWEKPVESDRASEIGCRYLHAILDHGEIAGKIIEIGQNICGVPAFVSDSDLVASPGDNAAPVILLGQSIGTKVPVLPGTIV